MTARTPYNGRAWWAIREWGRTSVGHDLQGLMFCGYYRDKMGIVGGLVSLLLAL